MLIAAGASVSIALEAISPVPITLQTLVVLSLVFILPRGLARAGVLLYIIAGIVGVPVFSEGRAGLEYFVEIAAGYLVGFILATYMIEWFWNGISRTRQFWRVFALQLTGSAVILVCGWVYLLMRGTPDITFGSALLPFLGGALLKSLVGAVLVILWFRFAPDRLQR